MYPPLTNVLEEKVAAAASLQTLLSVKLLSCTKRTGSQTGAGPLLMLDYSVCESLERILY